jgi:hypothetical protein
VGLGLLCGFVTVNFSGVGSLALCPTHNLEDQGLHFLWPLPFGKHSGTGNLWYWIIGKITVQFLFMIINIYIPLGFINMCKHFKKVDQVLFRIFCSVLCVKMCRTSNKFLENVAEVK